MYLNLFLMVRRLMMSLLESMQLILVDERMKTKLCRNTVVQYLRSNLVRNEVKFR